MRFSRDLFTVAILFAILIGLAAAITSVRGTQPADQIPVAYSTHTVTPQGAQALQLWLEELGYHTQRIESDTFSIPSNAQVLFSLGQSVYADARDAKTMIDWVAKGNTLVVADTSGFDKPNVLMDALQQTQDYVFGQVVDQVSVEQPIRGEWPTSPVKVNTLFGLTLKRTDYVQYLSAQGKPILVSFRQGKGTIWLASAPYMFTNDALHDEANAALIGIMLNGASNGALVAFDEYHLGIRNPTEAETLNDLLFKTPWGWAVLYSAVILLAFLIINGQRFGRVMPLPQAMARRSPGEYVTSMAQLFRRAGKRSMAVHHYYQHLKRNLGRPYRVNPDLPDEEFIAALTRADDRVDRDALAKLLNAFRQKRLTENGLVSLANQAIKFSKRRG